MVFSSHIFIFYFLPAFLAVYFIVPRGTKLIVLTLFSYFFYGWSNPYFVILMAASTVMDFVCGLVISGSSEPLSALPKNGNRSRKQKTALTVSICSNLALLGFFKYFNFGLDSYNNLMTAMGLDYMQWDLFLRITLPLGISFYTFQSMSYTIDVYRGDSVALRKFTTFACYVSMFPQLVAGPIIRFHEIARQLQVFKPTTEKFTRGVMFFLLGLAKKVILANSCGKIADTVFDAGSVYAVDAWYGISAYAFQIYFDFSGYSDMAIGLGLMLGFVFPKNFDRPYLSQSITEFWQRWHLYLSSWLRDYLYIPLGGNKKGNARTYANLAAVMLLGGLWHGAAWNYVIWGGIHGVLLIWERWLGKNSVYHKLPTTARVFITFLLVLIAWVFFRADSPVEAMNYLASMFGLSGVRDSAGLIDGIIYQPFYLILYFTSIYVVWGCRDTWGFTRSLTPMKAAYAVSLFALSLLLLSGQSYNPFLYFIF